MAQVIQLVQTTFEKFITERWIPLIRDAMLKHHVDSSGKLYDLGVPLPNLKVYLSPLEELRKLTPSVIPNADMSLLTTRDNNEFKQLLRCCVTSTLNHSTQDWLNMASHPALFASPKQILDRVAQAKTDLATAQFYLKTESYIAGLRTELETAASKFVEGQLRPLCAASNKQGVVELLMAVLSRPPPAPKRSFLSTAFLGSFFSSLVAAPNEDQLALCQLHRKPQLLAEFKKHLAGAVEKRDRLFSEQAKKLIADELVEFVVPQYNQPAAGQPVKSTALLLRPTQTENLGHRLLALFFSTVVMSLDKEIEGWVVPATALSEDAPTTNARNAALNQMLVAVQVLTFLKQMEADVSRAAA